VLKVDIAAYVVLLSTIGIKILLWMLCIFVLKTGHSTSVEAYAQDHLNDVLTNAVAVGCVLAAVNLGGLWWVADSVGAAGIAVYIMANWLSTLKEQVDQLTGKSASVEFLQRLTFVAANCDALIQQVDTVRAYHFGDKFLVEIHICLDGSMPLREAHDVGEKLELVVERIEEVERCFVHLDFETEHKPEYHRRLGIGSGSP
jgi:divalent metal cation (Fe/Co/Zn/Cd) transporter